METQATLRAKLAQALRLANICGDIRTRDTLTDLAAELDVRLRDRVEADAVSGRSPGHDRRPC